MDLALSIGRVPGSRDWQVSLLHRGQDGKIVIVKSSESGRDTAKGRALDLMQDVQHFLTWGKLPGEK